MTDAENAAAAFASVLARIARIEDPTAGVPALAAEVLDRYPGWTDREQTDPRELGGDIAGPGGPFEHGGVVLDASRAILADEVDVAKVDPDAGARGHDETFAILVGGRINQTQDRGKVMMFGDLDLFASLITEMHGVAERAGVDYARRLRDLCVERWAKMPHPPAG